MPRKARINVETEFFHVIVQGIDRKFIFNKSIYIEKYKKLLFDNLLNSGLVLLAYCIMDNHAHMLIHSNNIKNVSKYMQKVNTKFAVYYNEKEKRVGYVFRNRFLSEPIYKENYLLNCIAYIHMNPVEAHIVDNPWEYQHSSFNDYVWRQGVATNESIRLIFGGEGYMELYNIIHFGTYDFLDKTENKITDENEVKKFIEKYLITNNKDFNEVKNNKEEIIKLCKEMKKKGINYCFISKFLDVNCVKLSRLIRNE